MTKLRGISGIVLVSVGCLLAVYFQRSTKAPPVFWYIDNTASGANNGTSWPSAWRNFASITWSAINPGDTIFISGGSISQTYGETFTFGKAGTAGNLITLRIGQDLGHNGVAIINGNYVDMRASYTALDGSFGGANHFSIQNFFDTSTPDFAKAIYADGSVGNVVSYVGFTNVNNCYNNIGGRNWTISHCTADDVRGDAAWRTGSTPDAGYAQNIIEYCDTRLARNDGSGPNSPSGAPMLGPDGVQGGHSITVRYSRFRIKTVSYLTSYQHPDYTQLIGNHNQIYGNEFWNIGDSANDFDCWINSTMSHIQIYNNVYRITQDIDPFPEFIRVYSGRDTMVQLDDWLIANNTFVDNSWNNIRLIWKGTPAITNWRIENNIFVNSNPYEIASNLTGTIAFTNNVYYPSTLTLSYLCASGGGNTACNNYTATTWSAIEPSRIVGLPAFASYTYRSIANDFHLAAGDTVARGAGANLSAFFTVDKDAFTRTLPFACGAYQGSSAPAVGSILLSSTTYSVTEGAGSVTATLHRINGSSGAVGVSYATANGSALAGVNYTATVGTKSWADTDATDKTIVIPIDNTGFSGTKSFTIGIGSPTGGVTLGTVTNATVVITGSGTGAPLAGTSWPAVLGTLSAPMTAVGTNYITQLTETTDPAAAGIASFTFTNSVGPNVVVLLSVRGTNDASNSLFVNFGSIPTAPTMISDINPFTVGFENRLLSWRGNGAFDNNEFVPKVFSLGAGVQTLYILGREAGVQIAHVEVLAPSTNVPPVKPTNSLPAPSSLNVAPLTTLEATPYIGPGAAHAHSQFQVYTAAQTTLYWDSGLDNAGNGVLGPVTSVTARRMDFGMIYYWTVRYEDALGLWSPWSDPTYFQILPGLTFNVGTRLVTGNIRTSL